MERIDAWDVLLAYDFARLARNQEDLGWVRNRLKLQQKKAIEASTGLDLDNVGARVMGEIRSPALCWALFDVYLGSDPISEAGKATLIERFPKVLAATKSTGGR